MRCALAAGLLLSCLPLAAGVKITPGNDRISIEIDGKPFGDLLFGPGVWKPYLYPLRSASGKIVVRRFPMEHVAAEAGEKKDHNHQRGLWFAHGDVNGVNFWATDPLNQPEPDFGKIVLDKIGEIHNGDHSGSFVVTFDWNNPTGKTLLVEQRTMTFYSDPALRIIDIDLKLTARERVIFGDTKEGTFGLRINPALQEEKHGGRIVNAAGATGEENIWGKPSPWVDYSGSLDGEAIGVAIFDHAGNPGFPGRWHTRAYGLFCVNPFGLAEFVNDKNRHGGLTVAAGDTIRFRYRIVIHPAKADVAALYEEWAKGHLE